MVMKQNVLLIMLIGLFVLSGCATTTKSQQAEIKRITPEELKQLIPTAVATYSLEEIIVDSKQAKTPDEIIEKIKASESRYDLSASEVLELSEQGVDVKVLDHIQQSNELAKQNYLAEEINKAKKEKEEAVRRLRHERLFYRHRLYDPFWYSRFGLYYGRPIGPLPYRWPYGW
jgi:hypothetical protein